MSGRFLMVKLHAHAVDEIGTAKQAGGKTGCAGEVLSWDPAKDGVVRFALKPEFDDLRLDENGQYAKCE